MLGGQFFGGMPKPFKPGIIKVARCERTHAYAIRGRFMRDLYQTWVSTDGTCDWSRKSETLGHCDHVMGAVQKDYRVYAPDPFVVGQRAGMSDISGGHNPTKFWKEPTGKEPVVVLHASREVVAGLREHGFHTGFSRDKETDIDLGLPPVFAAKDKTAQVERMRSWVQMIQWECVSSGLVATIWHPQATADLPRRCWSGPVFDLVATSVDDALAQWERLKIAQGVAA